MWQYTTKLKLKPVSRPLSVNDFIIGNTLTIFFSLVHHLLKICSDSPPCNMPGVANTTIGPGFSMYDRSNDYNTREVTINLMDLEFTFAVI